MPERLVEIPVSRDTRNKLKKIKGVLTYEQLFKEFLKYNKIGKGKSFFKEVMYGSK